MNQIKNLLSGFLISAIGSLPLGYLNAVGLSIYVQNGFLSLCYFIFGIIFIEWIFIYFTLILSNKLIENKKLNSYIEIGFVVFLFVLAFIFYNQSTNQLSTQVNSLESNSNYFLKGILLNSVNFIQIPFWISWNLYLKVNGYLNVEKFGKWIYLFGIGIGTMCGMLLIISFLHYFVSQVDFLQKYLINLIIPLVLVFMGIWQFVKWSRKRTI